MAMQLANLCYKLFKGRRDSFAVQKQETEGISYYRVQREITPIEYAAHLKGTTVLGIYPLLPSGEYVYCAAIDIDSPDIELARKVADLVPKPNYLERSRSGNYHIWMFFKEAAPIATLEAKCRQGVDLARDSGDHHCSLYPLPTRKGLGLLIALPLQPKSLRQGLTAFIDALGEPIADNYAFLKTLKHTHLHKGVLDEPEARRLWLGQGKTAGDRSKSGYDFSFARYCFQRGLHAKEVEKLLLRRPGLHSSEVAYIEKTLESAAKKGKPEERIVNEKSWGDIKPLNREAFYKLLATRLVLGKEQIQQFDMFFAALVANIKTRGRPVWLLFIGPPGSGKTMPMMAIRNSPFVYSASSFRPTALISGWGMKGGEDMSLIPKLNGKVLLVKDMSSLLSQNRDIVAEVMGLLRDAYDGFCSRPFATGVERSYVSRFGFIGATTPDIDVHWSLNVRLGERFLRYRVHSSLEQVYEKIDRSLEALLVEQEFDATIEEACMGFLKHLTREGPLPQLSQFKQIGRLAQLGAILRTAVARGQYSQHVLVIPVWEEATRYAKQLAKMALGLAYVREKSTNGKEELADLKTLVRDSMDARMEKICRTVYANKNGSDTKEIAATMCLPSWTVRACLDDLSTARILTPSRQGFTASWAFVPWVRGQLNHFELWDKE